jgi:hypothetical protein
MYELEPWFYECRNAKKVLLSVALFLVFVIVGTVIEWLATATTSSGNNRPLKQLQQRQQGTAEAAAVSQRYGIGGGGGGGGESKQSSLQQQGGGYDVSDMRHNEVGAQAEASIMRLTAAAVARSGGGGGGGGGDFALLVDDAEREQQQKAAMQKKQQQQSSSAVYKFFTSFSVISNVKALGKSQPSTPHVDLRAVNGIRVISMLWIILAHTIALVGSLYFNSNYIYQKVVRRFSFSLILQGFVAVDSFFVLAGLLGTFLVMEAIRGPKRRGRSLSFGEWCLTIVQRYLRLTPIYLFWIVVWMWLTPVLGLNQGPLYFYLNQSGTYAFVCCLYARHCVSSRRIKSIRISLLTAANNKQSYTHTHTHSHTRARARAHTHTSRRQRIGSVQKVLVDQHSVH